MSAEKRGVASQTRATLARLAGKEGIAITAAMSSHDIADLLVEKWSRDPGPPVVAVIEWPPDDDAPAITDRLATIARGKVLR